MAAKILGIDIGSYYIKMAVIEVRNSMITISYPSVFRTPAFLVQNGRITDREELEKLIKVNLPQRLRINETVVILNDGITVTKDMELPAAGRKETLQMIKANASLYMPESIKNYTIRHRLLTSFDKGGNRFNYIMVASIPASLSMEFYKLFLRLGLKPAVFDVSMNAIIKYTDNVLNLYKKGNNTETIAVVDIGASFTRMVVSHNGIIVHHRLLNQNSRKIDVVIANTLDIDNDTAEKYKIKYGLGKSASGIPEEYEEAVSSIVRSNVDLLMNEIYRQIQVLESEKGIHVKHIWLTGGMALMKGLGAHMQAALNIPCSAVQQGWDVKFRSEADKHQLITQKSGYEDKYCYFTNIIGAVFREE